MILTPIVAMLAVTIVVEWQYDDEREEIYIDEVHEELTIEHHEQGVLKKSLIRNPQ